ncbi:beta galactosidase jelly roll domain-containing protein [Maribellus sp. CM-23]|uniref:glycoside hydrolase family 2 protein n=1 Tax=Maribellus sp. CM-23 TaxID=2781026 RepID=UPI001F3B9792|nr:sugar-binding domain-containing protein [Maribellus sp. CM-23]MCE4562846.1 beta galactosidase jelly roll domain-containing protein [Maribellus sp. CM-23]
MKRRNYFHKTLRLLLAGMFFMTACTPAEKELVSRVENLSSGWKMQASEKLAGVEESSISENGFSDDAWLQASVPGTVLGSMATYGVIEDPYFGINMQSVDIEQFKKPWWFRSAFQLSAGDLKKHISLRFNGINYRAELWVNGEKVAGKDEFAGAYRMFTFAIDEYVQEGENTLALKLWQHADGEYSIGFVDWNPLPRDRNMGIFREVFLEVNEGVKIRSPFVSSKVNTENLKDADLFIQAEIENQSDKPVEGLVRVDFGIGTVEKKVQIAAGDTLSCRFTSEEFAQLSVKDVKFWWPNGMGDPNLYDMTVEFISGKKVLDKVESRYGIREINSYLNEDKNRVFTINGKFVLLKGGGWVDDLLLQDTRESVEAQMKYIRHMNLNSIRCEGFWGKTQMLYDLCDEYGILVMAGFNCHWEWEEYLLKPTHEKYGGAVTPEDINLLAAYWKDQMLWLRNHPAIYVWMLGSDKLPIPELEYKYIDLFKKYDSSRPYITSAGGAGTEDNNIVAEVPLISEISGPTGMKMLGPYAYTPPVYWFTDTQLGGAYGFNTETCPGPNVMPLSSLKKMLPEESLWPIDKKYWEYHTGRNAFTTLDRFRKAMDERYGPSNSVEEFAFKCQVSNYELMRPMFEAFIAHKPKSTGLVQWMLNSAWPELYWQLYDTYLQPNGSFYGVRKACNPIHAIYRYGFDDIYLANEDLNDANNLTVKIAAYDINSKEIFSDEWKGDLATNTSKFIYKLPEIAGLTSVWFLRLNVFDQDNREVDHSTYWLSLKQDELDYEAAKKLEWPFYTPPKAYADFKALNKLPEVRLEYDYKYEKEGEKGNITLTVRNPGESIAFFTYFDLVNPGTDDPILPVYWNDNYVTLFPGEERVYTANFDLVNLKGERPELKVKAWNVKPNRIN